MALFIVILSFMHKQLWYDVVKSLGKPVIRLQTKILAFWYQIEEHFLENTMTLKLKPCSFPLQSYKNPHFCIHVIVDVNFKIKAMLFSIAEL